MGIGLLERADVCQDCERENPQPQAPRPDSVLNRIEEDRPRLLARDIPRGYANRHHPRRRRSGTRQKPFHRQTPVNPESGNHDDGDFGFPLGYSSEEEAV